MNQINLILKLNALSCLLFGALFVFIPETIIAFLADNNHMPKLVLVALGVVLNLWGMLLIWLSNREPVPNVLLLIVAMGDFLWVAATVVLLLIQVWVNSSNGIAAAGLVAMLVGWFGLQQFQHYRNNK
ncbi:hypothetical protein [Marinicella rhabdoformis]|uniref:hypothetical protein n=1 Tax=Marinicella rhabdoformis TaxID=2580566 RepID=UPI0012AEC37C|nr:hypothetical protein [Marinicella rhabdoformis]